MLTIWQGTKKTVDQIVENHLYNLTLTSEEVLLFNNSLNDLNEKCNHWHKIEQITLDVTELRRNKLYIQVKKSLLLRIQNMELYFHNSIVRLYLFTNFSGLRQLYKLGDQLVYTNTGTRCAKLPCLSVIKE